MKNPQNIPEEAILDALLQLILLPKLELRLMLWSKNKKSDCRQK
jgi:hypothetical protein